MFVTRNHNNKNKKSHCIALGRQYAAADCKTAAGYQLAGLACEFVKNGCDPGQTQTARKIFCKTAKKHGEEKYLCWNDRTGQKKAQKEEAELIGTKIFIGNLFLPLAPQSNSNWKSRRFSFLLFCLDP